MSIRSHGSGSGRTLARALTTLVLLLVPASVATAACPVQKTTKAFAGWGDTADYAQIPGGSFENGASGWTFISSKLLLGNDEWDVLPGTHSAALGTGIGSLAATAISPPFCVDATHPYFRFMFKPTAPAGALTTFIIYKNASGNLIQQIVGSRVNTTIMPGAWRPSQINPLSINIPLLEAGGTATVQLGFMSPLSWGGASYYVDNILVDPYRRG
ncbi:MAG: hypothetical protein PGN13_02105 [Patulibacter minatonensis]